MSAADRAWQRFLALPTTMANETRDFSEWHRGRHRYAVWAIALPSDAGDKRRVEAADALAGLLLPDYQRQPHITLHACGFPVSVACHDDDFSAHRFRAQCEALRALASKPFELQLGGLGSFATAPYLEVIDPSNALPRLRSALAVGGSEFRDTEYVPHVTVGLYGAAHPIDEVVRRMVPLRRPAPLPLPVRRLALMAYESAVIGGPLETLCEFDLADNLLIGGDDFFR